MRKRLAYLCLQATRQGQASHAHVHEILKGLIELGWDCTLFEPSYSHSKKPVSVGRKLLEFCFVQMRCALDVRNVRVLYVRDHPAALPAMIVARIVGVPMVLEVNGPYDELAVSYPRLRPWLLIVARLFRWRCTLATAIISVTPELAAWMTERGVDQSRIFVIGNGADTCHFVPARPQGARDYVVFFGVLAPWQGIRTMLEATESPSWPDGVHLRIAGDGVESGLVQQAAMDSERVQYLGTVAYEEMPAVLSQALASLVVKNNLGDRTATGLSPLKLYESMAAGLPVIVSDLPGLSNVIRDHDCGVLVPVGDPEALAKAVDYLWRNPEEAAAMGAEGRRAVVAHHSWQAAAEQTHRVLLSSSEGGDVTDD